MHQTNHFEINGMASPQEAGEEVADVLRRELAKGVAW